MNVLIILIHICNSQGNICICKEKCSILCPKEKFNGSKFDERFTKLIESKSKEIEIYFYSGEDAFEFLFDENYLEGRSIKLRTLLENEKVDIIFYKGNKELNKHIQLTSNKQYTLHISLPTKTNNSKRYFLDQMTDNINNRDNENKTVHINLEGLINVTCDKFEYSSDWGEGICVKNRRVIYGSYTRNKGAKIKYNFTGKRVHILAHREIDSGFANIKIDEVLISRVNFKAARKDTKENYSDIVFSSDELQYGDHTIEIENSGNDESVVIASLYIDPLPKEGGKVIGIEEMKEKRYNIEEMKEKRYNNPPVFSSTSENSKCVFNFKGTKFWLTGVRSENEGEFDIIIDDKERIEINERKNEPIAQNNMPILLYQSDVLEHGSHCIKVISKKIQISLFNFIYSSGIESNRKPILLESQNYESINITEPTGKYADDSYVRCFRIPTTDFTYHSNGDYESFTITNLFDDDNNTNWVSSVVETETSKSFIIINFNKNISLDAILLGLTYRTRNGIREYPGSPRVVKIYASTNDEPYELMNVFSGGPEEGDVWNKIQLKFPNSFICERLKLEFSEVTLNVFYDNNYTVILSELYLIGRSINDSDILHISGVTGNYASTAYIDANKISTNAFTYYSNGDIEQHPISNAFDGISNSYWVSSINETEF